MRILMIGSNNPWRMEAALERAFHRAGHDTLLIDDRRTVADLVDGVRDRIKNAPPEVDQDVMKFLEAALARDLILVE